MKNTIIFTILAIFGIMGLTACPDSSNTNRSNMNNSSNNSMMNNTANNMTNNQTTNNSTNSANVNSNSTAVVQDNFWINAAQGGMAEVELAKLALQKSQNADVKKFAQTMITDHTKANNELKELAAKKNIKLPTEMSDSHKSDMENLKKLSGAEFDKEYVEMMVDDHESDVEMFEDNTSNSDADIKAFTTKTLPTLKSHLQMIKDIQNKMK